MAVGTNTMDAGSDSAASARQQLYDNFTALGFGPTTTGVTTTGVASKVVKTDSLGDIYERGFRVAEDFKANEKIPSIYTSAAGYVAISDNPNINVGTNTFSFITEQIFSNGSTNRTKIYKFASNVGYQLIHTSTNKIAVSIQDGTNTLTLTSTNAIIDNNFNKIGFIFGNDSASCKLIIGGVEDTTVVKTGTYPNLTKTNAGILYFVSINGASHVNEGRNLKLFNYALTVAEMQKYMYQDLEYSLIGGSNTDLTLGNGSFATDTTGWWIKAGGTLTWNSGTADATFVSDGLQGGGSTYIYKAGTFLTVGKRYRIKYKAKSTNHTGIPYAYGGSGSVINTLKAPPLTTTYQDYETEIIATSSAFGLFPFYSFGASLVTAGLDCTIDDLIVQQIGCIAEYTEDTMTATYWYDKSGNNNHGLLTNCTLNNQKKYQQEINGYSIDVRGANVASATTITPTGSVFHVTGTTAIATINIPFAGFIGSIKIIPDGIFTTNIAGNIALGSTAVVNKALIMTYDSTTSKWYPSY